VTSLGNCDDCAYALAGGKVCRVLETRAAGHEGVAEWVDQYDLGNGVTLAGAPPCPRWWPAAGQQPSLALPPVSGAAPRPVGRCLAVLHDDGPQCQHDESYRHEWHKHEEGGRLVVWRVNSDGSCTHWRGGR
jgi:hypothetical protein